MRKDVGSDVTGYVAGAIGAGAEMPGTWLTF